MNYHRMKLFTPFACAGLLLLGLFNACAAPVVAGPKGGRLLEKTEPRAEFFVGKDRTVTITFYDAALKPVAVTGQLVTVIAETKAGKVTLEFAKKDGGLVSKIALPEGDGYNLIVQVKSAPGARPQNFRFKYDAHHCGGCKRAEYACTCGH
jgi:hypothetical protein